MTRLLVTGATGFLGGWLCARGIARGMTVGGTYHTAGEPADLDASFAVDLGNGPPDHLADFDPDVVVHAAALSSVEACEENPELAERVNIDGTRDIARFAAVHDARFLAISTNFVFGGADCPYVEGDEPDPIQTYGRTKHAAERVACEHHPDPTIVRVSDLYGYSAWEDGESRLLDWLLECSRKDEETKLVNDVYMSPTYVISAADEVLELATGDWSGIYHRSGTDCMNRAEFGRTLADVYGTDRSFVAECSWRDLWEAPRPPRTCLSSTRTRNYVPETAESLRQGLQRSKDSRGSPFT